MTFLTFDDGEATLDTSPWGNTLDWVKWIQQSKALSYDIETPQDPRTGYGIYQQTQIQYNQGQQTPLTPGGNQGNVGGTLILNTLAALGRL